MQTKSSPMKQGKQAMRPNQDTSIPPDTRFDESPQRQVENMSLPMTGG
jgi:hypothetical protein